MNKVGDCSIKEYELGFHVAFNCIVGRENDKFKVLEIEFSEYDTVRGIFRRYYEVANIDHAFVTNDYTPYNYFNYHVGNTNMTKKKILAAAREYKVESYKLGSKNCRHFVDFLLERMGFDKSCGDFGFLVGCSRLKLSAVASLNSFGKKALVPVLMAARGLSIKTPEQEVRIKNFGAKKEKLIKKIG